MDIVKNICSVSCCSTSGLYLCAHTATCGCLRCAYDDDSDLERSLIAVGGAGGESAADLEGRRARRWVRESPVTWLDMLRYVIVACQVAIEGIVSFFNSERLFQRMSVVLQSSGQRVRAFKSIDNYGIVIRFGRTLSSISDMVMAELFERFPGVFEATEAAAEGDDLVERLHSVQTAVTADLVGPRLLALDRAVVRLLVSILVACSAAVMFIAVSFPLDTLISRWLTALFGSHDYSNLAGPDDGTSLYRVLIYLIILFFACIMFLAIFSMVLLNALLSACANIMLDLSPASVAKVFSSYQQATGAVIARDRVKDAFGRTTRTAASMHGARSKDFQGGNISIPINATSSSHTNFREIFRDKVSWLRFAEPEDMQVWWAQLQKDVEHCRKELADATAALLAIVNLGASVLVTCLLIAFSVSAPLLQKLLIGGALVAAIICGIVAGYFTGTSRSYAIVVLSEVSRHMDAVFDSESEYKRAESGCCRSLVRCLCTSCLPKEHAPEPLDEWQRRRGSSLE